jgi:hypothetical protein
MDVTLPPDMQELHKTLNERLNAGIRKSFTPCPLIGPNWLQYFPTANPQTSVSSASANSPKPSADPPTRSWRSS